MYSYGGTSPAGFDCSGFTAYVFRQVGISLPRTAEQQRQAVTRVSNPQPGDLVFFGFAGLPRRHLRRKRHDVGLAAQRQGGRAPLDLVLQRHLRAPLT